MKATDLDVSRDLRIIIGVTQRDAIKKRITSNQVKPKTPGKSGTTLVGSGALKNSINYKIIGGKVVVSSPLPYARIHHEGGVIRPKKAKYLAIPLTPLARVMRPRDFEDTFIRKGVILRKHEGKLEALYALKKQVTMPAQPYMYTSDTDIGRLKNRIAAYWRKHGTL